MIPDAELVVGRYLRAHPLVAPVRVVPGQPSSTDSPWVELVQLDGRSLRELGIEYSIDFLLQLGCHAGRNGDQALVSRLARGVRQALNEMPGVHDGVVVTNTRVASDARIPDTTFEPAMERRILTVTVSMHQVSP